MKRVVAMPSGSESVGGETPEQISALGEAQWIDGGEALERGEEGGSAEDERVGGLAAGMCTDGGEVNGAGQTGAQRPEEEAGARQDGGYIGMVGMQTWELLRKNTTLALRNRIGTGLRLTTPLIFTCLVYVVNQGLRNRYRGDPFFRSVPHPEPTTIGPIPRCEHAEGGTCRMFAYSPAFYDKYEPSSDVASLSDLLGEGVVPGHCAGCVDADCDPQGVKCASCCESLRVHIVVRGILRNNNGEGGRELPGSAALGFRNETAMNDFVVRNPQAMVQGTYVFSSPGYGKTTFVVGQNSTRNTARGEVDRPQLRVTVPMQVTASREIARQLIWRDETVPFRVRISEFAHPAFEVATSFEGFIMPLFLLSCLIFPFVMQLTDVLTDKEYRLRQALVAVGLTDLAYWLSWHTFQTCLSALQSILLSAFGRAFGFSIFSKNSFGALFVTFFLFLQSMSGLSFFLGSILSRTTEAVPVGFGVFLLSFAVYFVVDIFRFPFGRLHRLEPYSYEFGGDGTLVQKTNGDVFVEPLFAIFPPTMLIKAVADLGVLSSDDAEGLNVAGAHSYCNPSERCNPAFSLRSIWTWFILQWALFSVAALYLDNILPDALGARKPLLYWASPSYWGLTCPSVRDEPDAETPGAEQGNEEEDEDVLAAASEVKALANKPMAVGAAIELRGLRKTYRKGKTDFHAVAGPWYSVGRKRLFALLGPNGAGKTTSISMLTGAVPMSGGNALVLGETVAHQSGLTRVRRRIGVCPQFDMLWPQLTALEHLRLFAKLKGVKAGSVRTEAARRLEEVRLTEVGDSLVESFSGGMKRRLSVAISLVGDPQVVFLDEPTTGMDPINRRHVWDVIESAKQDRCVVLTTHSMEEADALGDTVGIMAKGRLRCIGSAVRLKSRFGAGYKVSISSSNASAREELKKAFVESGGEDRVQVNEAGEYLHFSLHGLGDTEMAGLFRLIDEKRIALGVSDIQIGMSTLEDVFLRIVKKVEVEGAKLANARLKVELPDGEMVEVSPGDESEIASEKGTRFRVKWGMDEEGSLVAADVVVASAEKGGGVDGHRCTWMNDETEAGRQPEGLVGEDRPGTDDEVVRVVTEGKEEGPSDGGRVRLEEAEQMQELEKQGVVLAAGEATPGESSAKAAGMDRDLTGNKERMERMGALQSSFGAQAGALLRKNLSFQATRRCTNLLLVISPLLSLSVVLCLQYVVEELLLSQPRFRCPYCGPKGDTWGALSCPSGESCPDFFFPEEDRASLFQRHGVDVRDECLRLEKDCGGGGALDCFLPQYASTRQLPFCPFPTGVKEPSFNYAPSSKSLRSDTPVLFSGDDKQVAEELMLGVYPSARHGVPSRADVSASAAFAAQMLFSLLVATPVLGCANGDMTSLLSQSEEEAVCKLLQSGVVQGTERPCCVDLSDEATMPLLFEGGYGGGNLRENIHWWSTNPEHTDAAMEAQFAAAVGQGLNSGEARAAVARRWVAEGAQFASGVGKQALLSQTTSLPLPSDVIGVIDASILQAVINAAQPRFQCAVPRYSTDVADTMKRSYEGGCVNVQEGLTVLANVMNMSKAVHPNPEAPGAIPGCSRNQSCTFTGGMGSQFYTTVSERGRRWAQVCDYWTHVRASPDGEGTPEGDAARRLQAPCMCKWLLLAKVVSSNLLHPSGPAAGSLMRLPIQRGCREGGVCGHAAGGALLPVVAVGNIPSLTMVTSRWMETNLYTGAVNTVNQDCQGQCTWNCPNRFLTESEFKQEIGSAGARRFWKDDGVRTGFYDVVADSCADMAAEVCFARRMANLSGIGLGCFEAKGQWMASREEMDERIFEGQHNMEYAGPGPDPQEEFLQGFDWGSTTKQGLDVTIFFNDTSLLVTGGRRFNPNPRMIRIHEPLRLAMDAFINWRQGVPPFTHTSAMMGIQEMPKPANIPSLDLGSLVGPFLFTLVMALPVPVIGVSIVYEKEVRLRVLMQMLGLGTPAYFVINYLFWLIVYILFLVIFYICASTFTLPSGYSIAIVTSNSGSVQALYAFLVVNNTIAFSLLFSTIFSRTRTIQLCSTLWVIGLTLIGWACWDVRSGNIFNMPKVSVHVKNFITAFPLWAQFRAWMELNEYAAKAQRLGISGMQWSDMSGGSDGRCGMGAVLLFLAVEWPVFLLLTVYLDQVLDSGRGVPRHPLFFLGWGRKASRVVLGDVEAGNEKGLTTEEGEDVKEEAERVSRLIDAGEDHSAVVIVGLRKVFEARGATKRKVAVKNLTMAVTTGECFGMLGPNGAGKTTTISMLVGFTRPSAGYAMLNSLDIRTSMRKIYTLMGVCPQHDILWEALTASQHLYFYARLKNIARDRLKESVRQALRSVNLLSVAHDKVSTFSGGMKRRLSVAISLIGQPVCCYLDEPSTGLDPASRRTLWLAVNKAKEKSTVFLTTHSMEEAEHLCDRLGIFVDGALRCVGSPKQLTRKYGGQYQVTVYCNAGCEQRVTEAILGLAEGARVTYALARTIKYEVPCSGMTLAQLFQAVNDVRQDAGILDWGVATTTLEEAFIKIARSNRESLA